MSTLAHVGKLVYVQTVFDTATLVSNYGHSTDCSTPTGLPHPNSDPNFKTWVYMLTNWNDQLSGQATGNLNIQATVNDLVNWRSTSLSSNTGDAAVIYKITTSTGGVITPPMMIISNPSEPFPPASMTGATSWPCPCNTEEDTVVDFYWQSTVLKAGSTAYQVYFFIDTEDATGKKVRYFYWWDPTITVQQS
ncbi:MAG: AidA/PixA family protein [Azospirillaceae bacterium]|nr:AidA/PixA family protein [Azospirillaceae bacterium]